MRQAVAANKKPLTKTQIIKALAEKTGKTQKEIIEIIEAMTDLAYTETKKKGKFTLPGLGILKLHKRKARMVRNPMTGEQFKAPAKTVVKFTVAKACKEAIAPTPAKK